MRKFDLKLLLSNIQRFRITYLLLVPPVVVTLLKTPLLAQYDISSVKFLLCGAAPLGPDASAQVEKLFSTNQARTRQGWGMTEATMAVTMFAPDEFDPTHRSVGYLVPNVQMKIVDEDGREVGYNEEGEALIRGPNVFQGYYKNAAATQDAWTADGWLKTGDMVTIQPSGLVCIVDRKKVRSLAITPESTATADR
jgi:long-subunit acyl-CoA synthetase (AMP-forming)